MNGVVNPHAIPTSRKPASQRQTLACSGDGGDVVSEAMVSILMYVVYPICRVCAPPLDEIAKLSDGTSMELKMSWSVVLRRKELYSSRDSDI